jgi:hypothetical protein
MRLLFGAKTRAEEYICNGASSTTEKFAWRNRTASAKKFDRFESPRF